MLLVDLRWNNTGVNLTGGTGSSAQATVELLVDCKFNYYNQWWYWICYYMINLGLTGFYGLVLGLAHYKSYWNGIYCILISLGSGLVLDASTLITGSGSRLQVGTVGSGVVV
ncbi:MAG: hypothetical protein CM15mV5_2690 [uncultured marine virus]|nr:MAG: hypothetical protein CM15mV5_2690 [uncultured marine virus]